MLFGRSNWQTSDVPFFLLSLFISKKTPASYLCRLCSSPHKPLYLLLICAVYFNLILSFCLTQSHTRCFFIFHFSCGTNIHYRLLGNNLSFSFFSLQGQTFDYPFIWCVCVCSCQCVSPERGLAKLNSGLLQYSAW